jgi:hypothetical protein
MSDIQKRFTSGGELEIGKESTCHGGRYTKRCLEALLTETFTVVVKIDTCNGAAQQTTEAMDLTGDGHSAVYLFRTYADTTHQ